jgi:hypothetical protein
MNVTGLTGEDPPVSGDVVLYVGLLLNRYVRLDCLD